MGEELLFAFLGRQQHIFCDLNFDLSSSPISNNVGTYTLKDFLPNVRKLPCDLV